MALYGLCALGWLLVLSSTFLINHFDLFGLRQVWRHAQGRAPSLDTPFVTRAFYRIVRHPLMLGFLIAFWAAPTMSLRSEERRVGKAGCSTCRYRGSPY